VTSSRGAGRPAQGTASLSRQRILTAALPLIRRGGVEAISFRRLAEALGVSPMAVKYHVGNRKNLLASLVELAFRDTLGEIEATSPAERLRCVLLRYCARATAHANLVRCLLSDMSLMSDGIVAITDEIRKNTQQLNDGDPYDVMLNLLVDYTHGFVFSAIAAKPGQGPSMDDFQRSIDWLLASSSCARTSG